MLKNKIALLTGTNRGIGAATLKVFAENGARVYAHARKMTPEHEKKCKELSTRYKTVVIPVYFDFSDIDQIKAAVKKIKEDKNNIDILVNNIGIVNTVKLFTMTSMQEIKSEFDINFFAQMELTQYIARMMIRQKRGSIVNISSCAAIDGNTGMFPYVTSKSALIGATKRLAIELGAYGIRVNSVAPGLTDTDMANQMDKKLEDTTINHVILGRKAYPCEIANVIAFIASDLASYMTGQIVRVDGGMLL